MDLNETIQNAISNLNSGQLDNEAQVKQAVILPVLRALGWDYSDPSDLKPEYPVPSGSVDYALIYRGNPLVFIEAKRLGGIGLKGEEQLFNCANHRGVPLLILTDGSRWDFYLSMAAGYPRERRFYSLELSRKANIAEHKGFFRGASWESSCISDEARQAAERRIAGRQKRGMAQQAIPGAWQALLAEPDEMPCDLIAEKVESVVGIRPETDDIWDFLKLLPRPDGGHPPPKLPKPKKPSPTGRIVEFVLGGDQHDTGNAINTLARIVTRFAEADPEFMERFAKKTVGKTKRLLSKNRSELYASNHLIVRSRKLENGRWLGTNLSTRDIRAC